jgi:hypothetical protein
MGVKLQERLLSSETIYMKLKELPSQQKEKQGKWTLELECTIAESAILVEEPFVAIDRKKRPMVIYLPHHLPLETVEETERELLYLQKNYPPPEINGSEDKRHYLMKRVLDIYPKEKVGRYHFAWWYPTGHPHTEPVLSTDSMGGSATKMGTACNFIKKLTPLYRELSVALATIDFPLWKDCMEMMDKVWRRSVSSHNIKSYRLDAWHGCAVLSNVDIYIHLDLSDHKRGLAAMAVFGRFKGGEVVIPSLKVKFPFQPGDILFVRSSDLIHFVMEWSPMDGGERFCIIHYNHEDVVKYMEKVV